MCEWNNIQDAGDPTMFIVTEVLTGYGSQYAMVPYDRVDDPIKVNQAELRPCLLTRCPIINARTSRDEDPEPT